MNSRVKKCLIDTDIFSEIRREVNQTIVAHAAAYREEHGRYTISTPTVVEMISGYHRIRREAQIAEILQVLLSLEILTLDTDSAELAGRIHGDLWRTGQPIGWADPLIAAIALRNDLTLVTGNTAHYQRFRISATACNSTTGACHSCLRPKRHLSGRSRTADGLVPTDKR